MTAAPLRTAASTLLRHPEHSASVSGTVAVAVAVALPGSVLLRVERWIPLELGAGLRASAPGPIGGPGWGGSVRAPVDLRTAELDGLLAVLLVLVAAVILACALNLLVLVASHVSGRRREFAIRRAAGAAPGRIRSGLAAEGALLLLAGAGIGGAAGGALVRFALSLLPPVVTVAGGTAPRPGAAAVLALPAVAALAAGYLVIGPRIGAGLAIAGRRPRPVVGDLSSAIGPARWEKGLAAVQCGLLVALLAGSALIVRGATAQRPETRAASAAGELLVADRSLREAPPPDRRRAIERLLAEARRSPRAAAVASSGALLGLGTRAPVLCRGCQRGAMATPVLRTRPRLHAVGPRWFELAGADLLAGRGLAGDPEAAAPPAAVVNRAFAARFGLGGTGPWLLLPGRRYTDEWHRVVGVVEDLQPPGLGSPGTPVPAVYLPARRHPPAEVTVAVRDGGAGAAARLSRLLGTVRATAPGPPETLAARLEAHREPERRARDLSLLLAAAAWGTGLAGLSALTVLTLRRRRRELAVRRFAGARPRDVLALVLRDNLRTLGVGAALGAVLVTAEARALALFLTSADGLAPALSWTAAVGALGLGLAAATWLPVRRATRTSPREATSLG